jgi:hypothetical protein
MEMKKTNKPVSKKAGKVNMLGVKGKVTPKNGNIKVATKKSYM